MGSNAGESPRSRDGIQGFELDEVSQKRRIGRIGWRLEGVNGVNLELFFVRTKLVDGKTSRMRNYRRKKEHQAVQNRRGGPGPGEWIYTKSQDRKREG
jgi:hypothetical protein